MKWLIGALLLVVAFVTALLVLVSPPRPSPGSAPGRDTAVGVGHFSPQDSDVRVESSSEADGSDQRGNYLVRVGSPEPLGFSGSVTCLRVTGNRALVGGQVDTSQTRSPPEKSGVFIEIEDNGEPGEGRDRVQIQPVTAPPASCLDAPPRGGGSMITSGNYVVHDA